MLKLKQLEHMMKTSFDKSHFMYEKTDRKLRKCLTQSCASMAVSIRP